MPLLELNSLPNLQIARGINARVVTGDKMTVLHVIIDAGAELPEHSHHHEQILNLIEGDLMLTVDGKEYRMSGGDVMLLPSNVVHSGRAVSQCWVIDTFHPVREEFAGGKFKGYATEKKE